MKEEDKFGRGLFKSDRVLWVKWGEGIEDSKKKKQPILSLTRLDLNRFTAPSRRDCPPWQARRAGKHEYLMPDKFLKGTGKIGGWWGKYL